jgi:uncharacterized SAM-binding protein YcdF (DUF218 family)
VKAPRSTFFFALLGLALPWMIACERLREKAPWALALFLVGPWLFMAASFRMWIGGGRASAARLVAALLAIDFIADALHPYPNRFVHLPWELARVALVFVAARLPPLLAAKIARGFAYAIGATQLTAVVVFAVLAHIDESADSADAALVLGFALEPDGTPQPALVARADRAATLAKLGRVRFVLASGGASRAGHQEAEVIRELLLARGVPDDRIVLDRASRTTIENFVCSAPLLETRGIQRAFLVTDDWHMTRASFLASRYAPKVTFLRAPSTSPTARFYWLFAEVNGFAQELIWPNAGTTPACPTKP